MKSILLCITTLLLGSGILCFGQSPIKRKPLKMIVIETIEIESIYLEDLQQTKNITFSVEDTTRLNIRGAKLFFIDDVLIRCLGSIQISIEELTAKTNVKRNPRRDISNIAAMGGIVEKRNGTFSFNGARNAPLIFIDGVKTRGNITVPIAAIDYVEPLRLGLPANFGDTDSGIIIIESYSLFSEE